MGPMSRMRSTLSSRLSLGRSSARRASRAPENMHMLPQGDPGTHFGDVRAPLGRLTIEFDREGGGCHILLGPRGPRKRRTTER